MIERGITGRARWHAAVAPTDDGGVGPLPTGLSFPFHGVPRAQFYISMNGVTTFDTSSVTYDSTALPLSHNGPERAAPVPLVISMVVPEPAAALLAALARALRRRAAV